MTPGEPGLFGKLPSHGDFLTRRLAREFLDPWDQWLQSAVAASREALGQDGWLAAYLTSPVWNFALESGVCGPSSWAGILVPSVDRVGRYYPLTLAVELEAGAGALHCLRGGSDWFERAGRLAVEAVEADCTDLDEFDRAVQGLGTPGLEQAAILAPPTLDDVAPGVCLPLDGAGPPATLQKLGAGWLAAAFTDATVWWTDGSERVEPALVWSRALPRPESFASFLTGNWRGDGWQYPAGVRPSSTSAGQPA